MRYFRGDRLPSMDEEITFDGWLESNNPKLRKKLMSPRNKKITKKFYVGAPHLIEDNRDYCHTTLESAIAEAKEKCSESDEAQIVVQIIRIIRPAKAPVTVEKV